MASTVAQTGLTFRRGQIRIDLHGRVVYSDGQLAKLGSRAFALLEALIDRRDRLVPKQELMDVVWPGLVVEENNLQVHVATLRKLLGQEAIVTESGRGYRFVLVPDASEDPHVVSAKGSAGDPEAAHRLPAQLTLLIGREALTASICALARRNDVRLITLTGAGGSGKTRVALNVTAELAHDFADGSYIVMLAPVRDPKYVASAIAAVLNIQEAGNRPPEEMIVGYLRDREVLLALDNFEHVLGATSLIARLLDTCARLKVIVTSRTVLRLSAEHDVVVPPLVVPDARTTPNRAVESSAVRLFVERALAAGQDVGASENDTAIATQICRRLDGLPLAIELAAARLRVLTPHALLVRLEHSLQLLTSGPSNLPERQKTLRRAIDWSYELLEPLQQALFRRLSVFVGGWSLDAAEGVAGPDSTADSVLDLLAALVDHNLVQRIDDVVGEPRFTMLETVREFADEALQASGEGGDIHERHAAFYLNFAEKVEPQLTSGKRMPYLAQLQAELNNFRAALTRLIQVRAEAEAALRLAGSLTWMWYFAGQFSEGRDWLKRALEVPDAKKSAVARAKALSGAARLAAYAGDPAPAINLAEQSVELWRLTDDRRGLAFALFHLSIPLMMTYQRDTARKVLEESTQHFRDLNDDWGVALTIAYEGAALAVNPGTEDEARPFLLEGRARFSELDDAWGGSVASYYLGSIALRAGDYAAARELTEELLGVARDSNDSYRISRGLYTLADIAFSECKYDEAIAHLKNSLSLMREQGRQGDGAQVLRFIARLEQVLQHADRAVRLFAAASPLASKDRTLPHDDPALNENALDGARRSLGERRFEIEWAKGVAMSFDQAVAWVIAS